MAALVISSEPAIQDLMYRSLARPDFQVGLNNDFKRSRLCDSEAGVEADCVRSGHHPPQGQSGWQIESMGKKEPETSILGENKEIE